MHNNETNNVYLITWTLNYPDGSSTTPSLHKCKWTESYNEQHHKLEPKRKIAEPSNKF